MRFNVRIDADVKLVRILAGRLVHKASVSRPDVDDHTFAELAEEVGLARSTTHHHLAQLRAAGLIVLRGNARSYRYTLDADGVASAESLLGSLSR